MDPLSTEQPVNGVMERLRLVVADLFRCPPEAVNAQTGPGDIQGWDSLGHVALMAEIQRTFGRHVPVEDAIEVECLADLARVLAGLGVEGAAA